MHVRFGSAVETDPSAEEAEAAFAKGNEHYAKGELTDAIVAYDTALRYKEDPRVLANRGMAKAGYGCKAQGANDLARALVLLEAGGQPAGDLPSRLEELKKELGTLIVEVGGANATVHIHDGKTMAESYSLADNRPIYVAPGARLIEVRADGYVSAKRSIEVAAGEVLELTFDLEREEIESAAPAPPPARADDSEETAAFPWWPAAASGGVAVIAVVVGGGLWAGAQSAQDEASRLSDEARAQTGNSSFCLSPATPELAARCATIQDDLNQHDDYANSAVGLWIVGGAAALLSGSLLAAHLLVEPDAEEPALRFEVVPGVDPRGNPAVALRVGGAW